MSIQIPREQIELMLEQYLRHKWPTAVKVTVRPAYAPPFAEEILITSRGWIEAEDIWVALASSGPDTVYRLLQLAVERAKPSAIVYRKVETFAFWCAEHEELVSPEHWSNCQKLREDVLVEDGETVWFLQKPRKSAIERITCE